MKTAWLRSVIRRYGALGVLFVGAYLLLHSLGQRRRALLAALAIECLSIFAIVYLGIWLFLPHPQSRTMLPRRELLPGMLLYTEDFDEEPAAYTVTDLGTLPGGNASRGIRINDAGDVAGYSTDAEKHLRAVLWSGGQIRDLGTLGGTQAISNGFNEIGQVVGVSMMADGKSAHAFLWENGKMQDIGTLKGSFSAANAINNQGVLAGDSLTENGQFHGFVWQNGKMRDIGNLPGCQDGYARDINDKGQIVGASGSKNYHAFLWENGKMQDLGTLRGPNSSASAINANGQVVGAAQVGEIWHAFSWQNGKMKDLGTLSGFENSAAIGLNASGDVVGAAFKSNEMPHACLWRGGKATDLNKQIPSGSGWVLAIPYSINARGQIVGVGVNKGQVHAFLLTPDQG